MEKLFTKQYSVVQYKYGYGIILLGGNNSAVTFKYNI
jgi:hypothetical protein